MFNSSAWNNKRRRKRVRNNLEKKMEDAQKLNTHTFKQNINLFIIIISLTETNSSRISTIKQY